MTIETKKIKDQKCVNCKGKGIIHKQSFINNVYNQSFQKCPICNGTGRFKEYYSCYIDDKNKIAFGGEPGK